MKNVFVSLPIEYWRKEAEAKNLVEKLVRKVEDFSGESCKRIALNCAPLLDTYDGKDEGYAMAEFFEYAINSLCEADFSVFIYGWEEAIECRILHKVADECGVTPLVFKEEDLS